MQSVSADLNLTFGKWIKSIAWFFFFFGGEGQKLTLQIHHIVVRGMQFKVEGPHISYGNKNFWPSIQICQAEDKMPAPCFLLSRRKNVVFSYFQFQLHTYRVSFLNGPPQKVPSVSW